jgi:hypothetical protein
MTLLGGSILQTPAAVVYRAIDDEKIVGTLDNIAEW